MQTRIAVVFSFVFAVSGCRVVEPNPPPEAPRIGSFTASKTRVASGEEVTLSFTATGATKLELLDDAGHEVQAEGTASAGTAKVAPTRTSFYVLRATGQGGRDTAFVQIAVNEPLKDVFLLAVPATIEAGGSAQLLWGAAGATSVTLTAGSGTPQTLTGTTGTVTVSPTATERYTLTAQGAPGTPPLTAIASVDVHPVLASATLTAADGVLAGKTLTFAWRTAGAQRVTITEQTFGPLTTVTEASSVVMGTFDYVLPDTLPGGIAVADGLPLRFVVSATAGNVTVTRQLTTVVGEPPVIEVLDAPEYVSAAAHFDVHWKTLNATRVSIRVGGLPVFETLPGDTARAAEGTVSLPGPAMQTEYELVAISERGAEARRAFTVRNVSLPVISTFTLPGSINAAGDVANARWTTMNASFVQLRLKNGATAAVITTPSQVASGTFDLRPLTTATFVLEAFNQAGDSVTSEKTVTVPGSAVTVTPTPVLRGDTATLQWSLSSLNVLEVVGLATAAPTAVAASPNFVDLTTVSSAQPLFIADVADGVARIPTPPGFRFPSLGAVTPELWASVNGFLAYGRPAAALSANADFTATTTTPTMLAPLWDDLTLGMNSKVLWAMQTSLTSGERYLVVQWDKVQLAGDTNSELTFQVHLYESGQVSFLYKTLTGTLNSATVGIVERAAGVTQQFVYNGAPMSATLAPDLELVFFSGSPADGMQTLTARASKRIEFFGRTATGVLPVSAELRVFGPGDVTVTEAMPYPEATAANGQWVELRNNATVDVDFEGLVVASTGSSVDGGFVIPAGTIVPAGGYLVVGQSINLADNGGAPVDLAFSDVPLAVPDEVSVSIQGVNLGTLAWDAGVVGTSVQRVDNVLYASGSTPTCTRMRTFGPNGALGTPGAANESCAPYLVEPIGGGYVDLSANGGTIILGTASDYTGIGTFPLARPFTYFGQSYSSVNVSMVGFITFGPALTEAYNTTNDTTPGAGAPNGVIAPFWDEIVRNTNGELYMLERPDRTIISWQDFRIYATTSSAYFQVHLLTNGVIEFHYGSMSSTSATTIDRLRGQSATAWIEAADGSLAIPWSVNTLGGIQPDTGVRFTPVP